MVMFHLVILKEKREIFIFFNRYYFKKYTSFYYGEIVEITGGGGHLLGWTTQVAKNTRTYQLKCGRLAFSITYSTTPSSDYVEYYNIKNSATKI